MPQFLEIITRLVDRRSARTEAMVQADVRALLLAAPLDLADDQVVLEAPAGGGRRIDVEAGTTVFEVKRDLRGRRARNEALGQLAVYLDARQAERGERYAGVMTDGTDWVCLRLRARDGAARRASLAAATAGTMESGETEADLRLEEVSRVSLRPEDPDAPGLAVWLEGILATARPIPPTPREIERRLGAGSSFHALERATLRDLFLAHREAPAVQVKRQLWARLLTTALGSQFVDDDELFIEHTLLVNMAAVIAHAVLGLEVGLVKIDELLAGAHFEHRGIHGLIEPDFFDWVTEVPGGADFAIALARRLDRFAWQAVDHDVLKVLYESIITPATRRALGEYYTPEWLAQRIVDDTVDDPLRQRVLDPSCGSGTFLFHAVRRFLAAADAEGWTTERSLDGVTSHVFGIDLHPVAVTLARVTYVLALGSRRLAGPRGALRIPVYLGDSMQWHQRPLDLYSKGFLVLRLETPASGGGARSGGPDGELLAVELRFPEALLADAARFATLMAELARKARAHRPGSTVPSLAPTFERLAVPPEHRVAVESAFATFCDLQESSPGHIWGYFVSNLARPVWMAQPGNRVDVLVGNPPWLAYRHMPPDLQERFRRMSEERHLWAGAAVATQQDLSSLFVARAVELYLESGPVPGAERPRSRSPAETPAPETPVPEPRSPVPEPPRPGGRFAFVMPSSVLDGEHYRGFRSGEYSHPGHVVRVAFDPAWDLRRVRPHPFPRACAVVSGRRVEATVRPLTETVEAWEGKLRSGDHSWDEVAPRLRRRATTLGTAAEAGGSPYRALFRNGASVFPRVLFLVEEVPADPLGREAGKRLVRTVRSAYEKPPWRDLPSRQDAVESRFVHPLLLGEHVLPYRMLAPAQAVVPVEGGEILDGEHPRLDVFLGLARWWRGAEALWNEHRASDRLTLAQRLDYHGGLSAQWTGCPDDGSTASGTTAEASCRGPRVVYAKSGLHLAAARLACDGPPPVLDHTLYWAEVESDDEALYLCAVLNAAAVTRRVRPLMSYGKDERHVDKHVWKLPIPRFDPEEPLHVRLARGAMEVEAEVAALDLDEKRHFVGLRRAVRRHLEESAAAREVDTAVAELLAED